MHKSLNLLNKAWCIRKAQNHPNKYIKHIMQISITTTGPVILHGNTILTLQYTVPYNTYIISCTAVPIVSADDSNTNDLLLSTIRVGHVSFSFATAFEATHKPNSIVTISTRMWCHTNHAILNHGYVDRRHHNTGVTQSQTGTIIQVSREMLYM